MFELTLTVLALLLISGLSSGVEAAILSVPYSRVLAAIGAGRSGGKSLKTIKNEMHKPIMTVVILNNMANIVGSMTAGILAAKAFGETWVGVFSGILTFLVIVFAEVIPKTVGERHAEPIALFCAKPLLFISLILTPVIWVIEHFVAPFVNKSKRLVTSEEEITILTELGREAGIIEQDESELIQRVFRLNDITAWDMMTPRSKLDALEGSFCVRDVREQTLKFTHSRIPVYDGNLDRIIGVVSVREILQAIAMGHEDASLASLAQKAYFVPDSTPADDLLSHFQKTHVHLAIVVDSLGNILGVVTLEDVIEELVGEIIDETDVEPEKIKRISRLEILVDADTEIRRINKFFKTDLPGEGRIGDMLCEAFGAIPEVDASINLHDLVFHVVQGNSQCMQKIRIQKLAASPPKPETLRAMS